ncbi:MAG: site-specific integrase [Planctomycetales bacterium]
MLYRVAAFTGLRANELASLAESSFDLRSDPPTVTVEAGYSKRRRKDVLPLHADLAGSLATWFADRRGGEGRDLSLWPGSWMTKAADMLRVDLEAARAAWLDECGDDREARQARERTDFMRPEDEAGRVLDFHALRHSFVSHLASAGVHPKTAQELARHATITLTMDRYAHLAQADLAGALNTLPKLGNGGRPLAPLILPLAQKGDVACPAVSVCDGSEIPASRKRESPKSEQCQDLGDLRPVMSADVVERRRPDSNRGWRICKLNG